MQKVEVREIYVQLPRTDCGLCGNPSCWTFARRVYANLQKAPECPCNTEEGKKRIESIVGKGIQLTRKNVESRSIECRPCGEYTKVTLESQLPTIDDTVFDLFDTEEMCLLLHNTCTFTDVRCSEDTGYSMFSHLSSGVHVFKTGRVIVRRATDEVSARKTLNLLQRSLWGSVICSCGNTAISYAGGAVKNCGLYPFPPMLWNIPSGKVHMASLKEIIPEFKRRKLGKTLAKTLDELGEIEAAIGVLRGRLKSKVRLDAELHRRDLEPRIQHIDGLGSAFLVETKRNEEALIGLVLNGLARDLARVVVSLSSSYSDEEAPLLQDSLEIVAEGVRALIAGTTPDDALGLYDEFVRSWRESSKNSNIFKIATNGSYICSMASTRFPA
jgi:hypothetical protein